MHVKTSPWTSSFLTLSSGDAIVDTGATQDLIGQVAFEALTHTLASSQLKPIMVDTPVSVPLGIGGAAKVKGVALVPISPGGVPGILEFTILEHDVPPLLSVGFLEFLGAEIKLVTNQLLFTNIDVKILMRRLSSGHRTIPLVNWKPRQETFPIPDEIKTKFGLQEGAFDLDIAPSKYIKGRDSFPGWSSLLWLIADSRDESVSNGNPELHDEPNFQDCCQQLRFKSRSSQESHAFVVENQIESQDCKTVDDMRNPVNDARIGSELSAENPMGSLATRPISQFDQTPVSADHGGCCTQRGDALARPAGPCAADIGDLKTDAVQAGSIREEEEQHHQPFQVCGTDQRGSEHVPSPRRPSDEAWQPIRELDSLWSLRQSHDLCSQEHGCQGQGQGSPKVKHDGDDVTSTRTSSGKNVGGDGALMRHPSFLAGDSKSGLCSLELRTKPIHRGDEEPVRLHAEHDVGNGSAELSAFNDDGKAGKLDGGYGKQPITDADDDVPGSWCINRQPHGIGPTAGGGLSQYENSRRGEYVPLECRREHGESQRSRTVKPRWSSKVVAAATAWAVMVPFKQAAPEAQQFLTSKGLVDDIWIMKDDDIPARSWDFGGSHGVCPDDRALSNPGLCEPPKVCSDPRASSTPELCEHPKVCHDGRASSYPELPGPYTDCQGGVLWSMMVEPLPVKLGNFDLPAGSLRFSADFSSSSQMEETLGGFPSELIVWLEIEDSESNVLLESRPLKRHVRDEAFTDRPLRVTWWCLTPKAHWISCWANHAGLMVNFDEDFVEGRGPYWAFASTELSEALNEEEGRELPVKGHQSDLRRCGLSLASMVQKEKKASSRVDFVELFSPPRVSPVAQRLGLRIPDQTFDLEAGWDVRKVDHRRQFRNFQQDQRPGFLMSCPECKSYSALMNVNWSRMDPIKASQIRQEGHLMWNFSLEASEEQDDRGDYFALEHPAGASSWKLERTQRLLRRPSVAVIEFDMCALGLTVVPSGELSRKRTRIATNHPWLATQLCLRQCKGDHLHVPLENNLPSKARVYTHQLCELIAKAAKATALQLPIPSFAEWTFAAAVEDEDEAENDRVTHHEQSREADVLEESGPAPKVTESQKRMVMKVHVNTGHPPRSQFLRMMRVGGALPHVLKYIQEEFSCDQCEIKNKPDNRRRAHCPRSFAFNRVVSIDVLYIKYQQKSIPILNMVCTGSNYQIAQRLPVPEGNVGGAPTSDTAWRHFLQTWIRFFGPPAMAICDSGNEFKAKFERGCESQGILQHVILPECPWENSKAERHGGWLKEKLDKEVNSGACTFTTLQELDEFLTYLTAAKNRWFSRSGYTPAALVFGETPRIPGDLLSDDFPGLCAHEDAHSDPYGVDEASTEFRRRQEIREKARQAALEQTSKEAVSRAVKSATHQSRHWAPGQWVYVFRRGRPSQELHPRDRWVGPGVVVLANNRVIYVAMRTRLWRCAPEQLRAAMPSEVLGKEIASSPGLAELLRQVNSGTYKGAVDVTRERFPDNSEQFHPVERDHQGVGALQPQDERPTEAPAEVIPLPPGLAPVARADPEARTATESRRASMDSIRTVSEPEPLPTPLQVESNEPLETIVEEAEPVEPRPAKVPRREEDADASATSSGSGSNTGAHTRAPGSPIGPLLQIVNTRDPVPPHISIEPYEPLTPGEELSQTHRRVDRQVQEIEAEIGRRERSPRRSSAATSVPRMAPPSPFQDEELAEHESDEGQFYSKTCDFVSDYKGGWCFLAKRGDEISLKELSVKEKELFDQSDQAEWQAILSTKAVHVITGGEADRVRRLHSDRIISSRMVRRRKPQPGLNMWKAKSRWCLHGHADPDTGTLITYAPTPQAEGMSMFLQTSINQGMKISFGDVKNAFCQSDALRRPRGPLYAEPCPGLHLPPGALIAIDVPVYGLDDAPAAWRTTVTNFLINDLKFERNLVEPCWFTKFETSSRKVLAHVLVEVDDFIVAALPNYHEKLKTQLTQRFQFGKWEDKKAEYAGRHVECLDDRVLISQEKYILEQIFPVPLLRHRRGLPGEALEKEEFEAFRSLVYKLNWVGRETRPEVAGTASIMASRLPQAKIQDILTVNKVVNHLRCTASRPITIWKFNPDTMVFIVCSDAGGINTKHHELVDELGLPTDATQGSWMVLTAERLPEGNRAVRATPITWRSSKLKRKVFSTFGGETQAMLQGVNEVDWLQIMYRDASRHDVELKEWRNSLSPHMVIMRGDVQRLRRQPQCSVTDAKSLYDCLLRGNPSGKQDRKSALELAIILRDLQETRSMIRWVPHQKMLVDCMTKESIEKGNGAMTQFLRSGWLSLVDVQEELNHRKTNAAYRSRSLKASTDRLLKEYADQLQMFCHDSLVNLKWWVLSSCTIGSNTPD